MAPEVWLAGIIVSLAGLIAVLVWGVKTLVNTITAQNTNLRGSSQLNLDLVTRVDVLTRELAVLKFNSIVSDQQIAALTQNVAEKDRVIAGLQAENTALTTLVEKLQARVLKLEATIEARDTEIQSIKKSGAGPSVSPPVVHPAEHEPPAPEPGESTDTTSARTGQL